MRQRLLHGACEAQRRPLQLQLLLHLLLQKVVVGVVPHHQMLWLVLVLLQHDLGKQLWRRLLAD